MSTVKKIPLKLVGAFTVLLFLSVAVVSFFASKDYSSNQLNPNTYSTYEEFVAPIVMYDPAPFESVFDAQPDELIRMTVWSILSNEKDGGNLEYDKGSMLLPKSKVEEKFQSLFGEKMWFSHFSVDGGGVDFTYSEKDKAYLIPLAGVTPAYTPKVTEAYEEKGDTVLTVAYLDSQNWLQDSEGNTVAPEPAKYVKIILTKNREGAFSVKTIRELP